MLANIPVLLTRLIAILLNFLWRSMENENSFSTGIKLLET